MTKTAFVVKAVRPPLQSSFVADPINDQVERTYEKVRAAFASQIAAPDGELLGVAPHIRVLALRSPTLPPATHTNCYIVGPVDGPGPLLLVDPGSPYPESQQALDAVLQTEIAAGRTPWAVLLTHHHADHTGGVNHLRKRWNLEVLAHPLTAELTGSRALVTRPISPGVLQVGDLRAELLHTPGHASGHLCVKVEAANATLAGDLVAGVGTILIDPDEGDMTEYLDSLAALEAAAPGVLLPAHGPAILDGPGKLRAYRSHRLAREQKIADALAARGVATADELVPMAYADTPAPFWPLAVRSTLAHLKKLERDGRATCEGQRFAAR
ncbi:MAG: MBL fold metallo-hydrolase [Myxococcales bacterium]|nr:MBL fold metallo-hydrolase [Myxococcales bacterium]